MDSKINPRLRFAIAVAITVGVLIVIPGVLVLRDWGKVNVWEKRYPNRKPTWKGIQLYSVYDGDSLVYAFAVAFDTPVVESHDLHAKPQEEGVFWIAPMKDGLWVDGKRVSIPEGIKIIAVRTDKTIVPVQVTGSELDTLSKQFGRLERLDELHARIAAALKPPASSGTSTMPTQ